MARHFITKRYHIIRPLGEGGMGEVFLVEDRWENGRRVALKKLRRDVLSQVTRETFVREFTALKQLRHPNLCSVYDFGYTAQGDPFFTSEYCEGAELISATTQMGFGERVERAVEICRALAYIHARGYIHADLKPENILLHSLTRPDETNVKLLDFGLARHVSEETRHRLSGTLAYLAPETIKGRPLDPRADLYSLGVVLYQLFTRQLPFGDIDPQMLVNMQLSVMPSAPTEKDSTLPVAIDSIVLRLLKKEPEERFQSADDLIIAFNESLNTHFTVETQATAQGYVRSGRFVGRAAELSRLREALSQAQKKGRGRVVLVGGESGVGKSRLFEEFTTEAQIEGVRTLDGNAYEKIAQPFQCFLDVLRPLALHLKQMPEEGQKVLAKFETALSQVIPEVFDAEARGGSRAWVSANEKDFLLESLAMFIAEASSDQTTLITIQDLQWADTLSLELLEHLVKHIESIPLILGMTYRTEEIEDSPIKNSILALQQLSSTDWILIKPLDQQEVSELVHTTLGTDQVPTVVIQRVIQQTRGNPFFVQEVLWTWIEEGILSPRKVDWSIDPETLNAATIPRSMTDAFLRRVGYLNERQRNLLQVLALFNKPVTVEALSHVLDIDSKIIEQQLGNLVEKAILGRIESLEAPSYYFSHGQMKSSIESGVSPDVARKTHLAIGEYYESASASSPSDQSESLAFHFAAAGEAHKARVYSIRTGDKLRKFFSYEEAIRAYQTAESFIDASDERALEIREKIAFCHFQRGELDDAEAIYRSLVETAGKLITPGRAAKLHLRLGMIAEYRGKHQEAIDILNRGYQLIESLPEPKTKADLLARIGYEYQRISNYRLALDYVQNAIGLVAHLEDYFGLGDIYNDLFISYHYLGDYTKALEAGHRAIAVYTKFGWTKGVAGITANLGIIYEDHLSDYQQGIEYQRRALQLREKIFDRRGIMLSYLNLASLHTKLGQFSTALEYLTRATDLNKLTHEKVPEMAILNHQGENWLYLGEFDNAKRAFDQALEMAESSHVQPMKILTLYGLGAWHGKMGEWEESRKYALNALDLAVKTESKIEELRSRVGLAHIEMKAQRRNEANSLIVEALVIAEKLKHSDWTLELLLQQGQLAIGEPPPNQIESILRKAQPLAEKTQSPILQARFHWIQGQSLLARQDRYHYSGGEEFYQALRAAESTEDYELIATMHHALGLWYLKQHDKQSAERHLQCARSIVESVADRLGDELKKNYLATRWCQTILEPVPSTTSKNTEEVPVQAMEVEKSTATSVHHQNYTVTLFQISKIVNSILNLNELLEQVMDLVLEALRVERGLILLVNEDSGELEVKGARNISKATVEDATAISKTVLEEVVRGGKPLISVNAQDDQRLRERRSIVDFGIGMVLCFPLTVKQKVIGAVYIDNPVATLPFNEEDVNFLMSFTNLFGIAIENARLYEKLNQENIYLRQEVRGKYSYENIVGRSPKMTELFRRLDNVVNSSSNVLITGESGTGKELIARAIHYNGARKEKRFVAIDCGAIPENLIESELFGYKKGAFTGAIYDKKGLFEEAEGGTIFLDEITNTSHTLQAKLLRVIQEREIRRLGDSVDRKVDVRLIAATNRDLKQMVQRAEFREDLFYRLNVLTVNVPPLRERKEDIPLLVNYMLKQLAKQNPSMPRTMSREAMSALKHYPFPGNVRELENLVESAYFMAPGEEIRLKDLPLDIVQHHKELIQAGTGRALSPRPAADRARSSASQREQDLGDDAVSTRLFLKMKVEGFSFWDVAKEPLMKREISKEVVREVIRMGLKETKGRYKELLPIFNLKDTEYTVFMNFLKKHDCQVDFKPYRQEETAN